MGRVMVREGRGWVRLGGKGWVREGEVLGGKGE